MNIFVPASWLRDFLKTSASAEKIAEVLSLCSQSVESIKKIGNDEVLNIEITVNRYDCLSIIGIAREAAAVLPQFGVKAKFVLPKIPTIPPVKNKDYFSILIRIENPTICPRFSAILIDQVQIKPSSQWIVERLNKVNIRAINNVVDISNYLMIETGQPIHTFDFDKILGQKMIMRLSKLGEEVTTLDGVARKLPGGDIVIQDGTGRLIDLCGIMGGQNSEIDNNTKRVLFFVQAYDATRVRKTSMSLGLRTEAAARFERGIDLEGIIPVIARGGELMEKLCEGKITGRLIDIYPQKQITPKIKVSFNFIERNLGTTISPKQILDILFRLGFTIESKDKESFIVKVPSFRVKDIQIPEDIFEEVARIWGYFRLPGRIPPLNEDFGLKPQPKPKKGVVGTVFKYEEKAKDFLKACGFSETYNFSFISRDLIEKCGFNPMHFLELKNPITSDLKYLRISLVPSLLNVFTSNTANFPQINIFEMASVYLPKKQDLPQEKLMLTGLTNTQNFQKFKGIITGLLAELGIIEPEIKPVLNREIASFWEKDAAAEILFQGKALGFLGQISKRVVKNFLPGEKVFAFDLDFETVSLFANESKIFTPIPKYPPIIEDLAFVLPKTTYLGQVIETIKSASPLIKNIELIDTFNQTKTLRITYQSLERNLSDRETAEIKEKIIRILEKKFGARLKTI